MDGEEERIRIEQIREIELEELQIEEVDEDYTSSSDAGGSMALENDGVADEFGDVIYDPCLVSLYSFLGEVDDTRPRVTFLDGGAILNLPMFYIEGVVLLPGATLPLRVVNPGFRASVEKALNQVDTPGTIGVVHVHKDPDNETLRFSTVGTTAEIKKYRLLEDGSFNVLTCGKLRFHLRHRWIDAQGAPCAEVQIIPEDLPLRAPKDAFGQLASITNLWNCKSSHQVIPDVSHAEHFCSEDDNYSESISETSFENDLSPEELLLHRSVINSRKRHRSDESTSSERSQFACELGHKVRRSCTYDSGGSSEHSFDGRSRNDSAGKDDGYQSVLGRKSDNGEVCKAWAAAESKLSRRAPRSFWGHWVYRMYDSYCLAQRAAVMWKQIIGAPSMDDLAKKPDLLSFHIGNIIPVSESLRQELLEIDGVSYRLRREIEFLECFDHVCCKTCQSVIAKRSEMLMMSSDGPLGAYSSIPGYVHEIKAFYKAKGLALTGRPSEEYSWFPGYAWTVATCTSCESVMGWLFTATDKTLEPESFCAIRCSQIADNNAHT